MTFRRYACVPNMNCCVLAPCCIAWQALLLPGGCLAKVLRPHWPACREQVAEAEGSGNSERQELEEARQDLCSAQGEACKLRQLLQEASDGRAAAVAALQEANDGRAVAEAALRQQQEGFGDLNAQVQGLIEEINTLRERCVAAERRTDGERRRAADHASEARDLELRLSERRCQVERLERQLAAEDWPEPGRVAAHASAQGSDDAPDGQQLTDLQQERTALHAEVGRLQQQLAAAGEAASAAEAAWQGDRAALQARAGELAEAAASERAAAAVEAGRWHVRAAALQADVAAAEEGARRMQELLTAERAAAQQSRAADAALVGERDARLAALQGSLAAAEARNAELEDALTVERAASEQLRGAAAADAQGHAANIAALESSVASAEARAAGLQKLFDCAHAEIAACADNVSAEQVREKLAFVAVACVL